MEFEFSVQIIDKFIGGGLVFIYLAAFLVFVDCEVEQGDDEYV